MKITELIELGWEKYKMKIASGLINPENEKMMQLQLSQIYETLSSVFESESDESIKILLEVPVIIRGETSRIIDIVISHARNGHVSYYPIELKCFRLYTRKGDGKKRGAQNIGMYDYWEDIENIEGYSTLINYKVGYQFTLTDDSYYVTTKHCGSQVSMYSTNNTRNNVTGNLIHNIANRAGKISLNGTYTMEGWQNIGNYWFVQQNI